MGKMKAVTSFITTNTKNKNRMKGITKDMMFRIKKNHQIIKMERVKISFMSKNKNKSKNKNRMVDNRQQITNSILRK